MLYIHWIKIVPIKPFFSLQFSAINTEINNQYYKIRCICVDSLCFSYPNYVVCLSELVQLCNALAMTARSSFYIAGKIAFVLWRHGQRRNGTMPTMRAALLCLLLLGVHEYPVLDRRPGSNDLELDFRWVCAVSCARNLVIASPL